MNPLAGAGKLEQYRKVIFRVRIILERSWSQSATHELMLEGSGRSPGSAVMMGQTPKSPGWYKWMRSHSTGQHQGDTGCIHSGSPEPRVSWLHTCPSASCRKTESEDLEGGCCHWDKTGNECLMWDWVPFLPADHHKDPDHIA